MPDYPVFFTVTGLYKACVGDGDDFEVNGDGIANLTADLIITPKIKRGNVIVGFDDEGSAIGFVAAPVKAIIDTDGLVKLRSEPDLPLRIVDTFADLPDPGLTTKTYKVEDTGKHYLWREDEETFQYVETLGYVPLRLLADQHLTAIDGELWYDVQPTKVKFNGVGGRMKGFSFRAPSYDTSVSLVELQAASYEGGDMRWTRTESGELVRRFLVKPGEHTEYTLNWANRMVADDTISAVEFDLVEASDDLELFSPTFSGYNTQVWVRGTPEVGARFAGQCEITTTMGRTLLQTVVWEAIYPAAESSPEATTHAYVTPSADRYWALPAISGEEITS